MDWASVIVALSGVILGGGSVVLFWYAESRKRHAEANQKNAEADKAGAEARGAMADADTKQFDHLMHVVNRLQAEVYELNERLDQITEERRSERIKHTEEISTLADKILRLENESREKDARIKALELEGREKDARISRLQKQIKTLEESNALLVKRAEAGL
jgi:predicted RNase H-like nuclease (RuvC/YqgF family)